MTVTLGGNTYTATVQSDPTRVCQRAGIDLTALGNGELTGERQRNQQWATAVR